MFWKERAIPMFEEALDKYDLPLEIKFLAIVESNFTLLRMVKAANTVEQTGFTSTIRADDSSDFTLLYLQADVA